MQISIPDGGPLANDAIVCDRFVDFDGARVLDLGCGRGDHARRIAAAYPVAEVVGIEADERQHALNAAAAPVDRVRFVAGRAEALPLADGSIDIALLFRSLHHVPAAAMDGAFEELARVVRRGGTVVVVEPVFAGDYNELVRLFNDEREVRAAAFAALERVVSGSRFELVEETFYRAPVHFRDFADFSARMFHATFRETKNDAETLAAVRERFSRSLGADGAHFLQHMRADVLRRR